MPAVTFPHSALAGGSRRDSRMPRLLGRGICWGVGVTCGRVRACRPIQRRPALGQYRRGLVRRRASDLHRRHAVTRPTTSGAQFARTATPSPWAGSEVGGRVSANSETDKRGRGLIRRTGASRCARSSARPPRENQHHGETEQGKRVGPRCHGFARSDIAGGCDHCVTAKPRRTRTATAAPRRPADSGRALPPCSRNVTPRTGAPGRQIPQA